ncbi:DsbA family oxidoreductase [Oligoflexus tunisiensis]|uniref:DsbA family oxidoreductase n=1 Tax=Oligoflexus tunisiensis TaxID=708132 RepID=UPI000ADEB7D3|nr:DsbA family oxidoreductase [Oligoflexus tunisiensis]
MISIEIWSDILCPFCYIGKHRFQKALTAFPHRDQVQVTWRSFELDPSAAQDYGISIHELLARKYGRTVEWARENNANLEAQALELGLTLHMDRIIPTNSFHAHRLLHLGKSLGLADQVYEKLFAAYFTEGRQIGKIESLIAIAEEAGLDREQARTVLESTDFTEAVRQDEDEAQLFGLTGVPAFVINRKYLVSGAQPPETFTQALQKIWDAPA